MHGPSVMRSPATSPDSTDYHRIPSFFQCPNCEKPTVMNIKAIHRGVFRGKDTIVYRCHSCGTEETEIMT